MQRLSVVLGILLMACGGSSVRTEPAAGRPGPGSNDEVMRDDTPAQAGTVMTVTIDPSHPEISMGDREAFSFRVRVTNSGEEHLDPNAHEAELEINQLTHPTFDLNRHDWTMLAPGESANAHHQNMGVSLFDGPGEYSLRLRVGETVSEPVIIRVTE